MSKHVGMQRVWLCQTTSRVFLQRKKSIIKIQILFTVLLQYGPDIGTFSPPDINTHKHIHGKTTIKTTIPMKTLTHEYNIHMHYACMNGFQNYCAAYISNFLMLTVGFVVKGLGRVNTIFLNIEKLQKYSTSIQNQIVQKYIPNVSAIAVI